MKLIKHLLSAIVISSLSFSVLADSNVASKGSATVSKGSIMIGEGASQVFASAAQSAVGFVVDSIEVSGEIVEVTLVTSAGVAKTSADVTISMASATLETLALSAGTAIEIMQVYNEQKEKVLGYLLLKKGDVLLFVAEEAGLLTLKSHKL